MINNTFRIHILFLRINSEIRSESFYQATVNGLTTRKGEYIDSASTSMLTIPVSIPLSSSSGQVTNKGELIT